MLIILMFNSSYRRSMQQSPYCLPLMVGVRGESPAALEFRLIIVFLSLCYGLIKRSQDFGRSLNNATLTQTHQKKQIISITHFMAEAYMILSF
ncbi:MAG: hypothetical protein O4805_05920 [Trichodesmium sp. St16_bin2-tuft]|jgi:hypothetical protein|nr:hypothetical protein [Trichodesmium sp. St16_bin2-tuft]